MSRISKSLAVLVATALAVSACNGVGPSDAAAPGHSQDQGSQDPSGHGTHGPGAPDGSDHLAALALVDAGAATHTAATSGDWTEPGTWRGGQVPDDGARVIVPEGRTVTIDGRLAPTFETIGVFGALRFAPTVDTELRVDTLVGAPSSRIEIGTPDRPVAPEVTARVVFADLGPIDRDRDPSQVGRGAVLHGATVVAGAARTHRAVVASAPTKGDRTLTLTAPPDGWHPGDAVVVTGTDGPTSDEIRTVESVDGVEVALDRDHVPPADDLDLYVGNLSRNVIFTSESPDTDRRGHVMSMHANDVDVRHARFHQLGRTDEKQPLEDVDFGETAAEGGNDHDGTEEPGPATNVRARYSVHVHRGGTDPAGRPARIEGSVVTEDPGWAFVNHSSNVDFVDNVSWDVRGSAFVTEAGDEVGSMTGNLAVRTVNPEFTLDDGGAIDPDTRSEEQDFAFQGDGFWLQGNRVRAEGNVAAGASAHGIIYWIEGLAQKGLGNSSIAVDTLPEPGRVGDRDRLEVWWAPPAPAEDNVA